jgi:hypothetical protein
MEKRLFNKENLFSINNIYKYNNNHGFKGRSFHHSKLKIRLKTNFQIKLRIKTMNKVIIILLSEFLNPN